MLYNCYMPLLEHGGLFVPTNDISSLGSEVLLTVEIIDHPKKSLRTQVTWTDPACTSAHRLKGVRLAFGTDEICIQTKQLTEAELGNVSRSDRVTFTP